MFGWLLGRNKKKPKEDNVPIIGKGTIIRADQPYMIMVQDVALTVSDDYDKFLTDALLTWEHNKHKAVSADVEITMILFIKELSLIRQRGRDATNETMNILKGS